MTGGDRVHPLSQLHVSEPIVPELYGFTNDFRRHGERVGPVLRRVRADRTDGASRVPGDGEHVAVRHPECPVRRQKRHLDEVDDAVEERPSWVLARLRQLRVHEGLDDVNLLPDVRMVFGQLVHSSQDVHWDPGAESVPRPASRKDVRRDLLNVPRVLERPRPAAHYRCRCLIRNPRVNCTDPDGVPGRG